MAKNKKFLISGNWKMNKTVSQSITFYRELDKKITLTKGVEVLIFPPFTALQGVKDISAKILTGAQNMYYEDSGAFTGEIAPIMVKEIVDYVLIGHSERRQIFKETEGQLNLKLKKALEINLKPVFCVGEILEQRESGKTLDIIRGQIERGLEGLNEQEISKIVFAYEPVWAIGTGKTATPQQAQEVHQYIRRVLSYKIDKKAEDILILYGGSVKPQNSFDILSLEDINGVLVGGASLHVDLFSDIIQSSCRIQNS